ncbi:FMN-binding negative transcriptional regulator [Caenimonas koreensis]|uniref:FMN-binding negative transcriptional regulator n=1 Tax=Caenimonas koreensis TaxID=367474 RepID=UPI0037848F69
MYQPPHFKSTDAAIAAELMTRIAFASLVSTDDAGFPFVTHLPMHLATNDGEFPSWNYLAVHCKVEARLVEEPGEKDVLLKKLIGDHEPAYADQWRGLGEEYQHKMLAGIVGLELRVKEWECKLKINQHRPESHAKLKASYSVGNAHERELAVWMDRLGMGA